MSEASSLQDNFSIRRHAVQQLLRQALDAEPEAVQGLLGGHGHSVEAVLALHGNLAKDAIRDAMQTWDEQGIRLLAAYSSEDSLQPLLPSAVLPDMVNATLPSLPQLIIRTDTKGRIEARLIAPATDGSTRTCALEMQEDGGLYPSGDRG